VNIFCGVTSSPKGALATGASRLLSILQRPSCKVLSRNQDSLRLAMSMSSHTWRSQKGMGYTSPTLLPFTLGKWKPRTEK
jgi:hypothetical protein